MSLARNLSKLAALLNGNGQVTVAGLSTGAPTWDANGNVSVGATLSSWRSGGGVIELNASINGYVAINGGGGGLLQNAFINSSNAAVYKNTGTALYYTLGSTGDYTWNRAVSGTAGGTITWVPSMTLNASGYLGIGDTTPSYPLEIGSSASASAPMLAINPQTATNAAVLFMNNGGPGGFYIGRTSSTGAGAGSATLPVSGAAFVWCDSTQPIIFGTNNSEAARFDTGGNLVIGGTSASDKLTVKWAQTSNSFGYFSNTADGNTGIRIQNSGRDFGIFVNGGSGSSNYLRIYDWTAGADRMIINSTGAVSIGTTSVYGTGTPLTGPFSQIGAVSTNPSAIVWGAYGSAGGLPQFCGNWASTNSWGIGPHSSNNDNIVRIGQITIGASGAAWNGTYSNVYAGAYTNASDYRIKKDVADLPAVLAKVLTLRPITYCAIHVPDEDGDVIPDRTEVGFIAHEVQALFPEVVSGEKDEVDPSGRPQHQGLEYAKMVTILTKAIQEQQAIIEGLTSRIAALEAA